MVDRCVCVNKTFEDLKQISKRHGYSLDELRDETGCCSGCTSCEPYVRLMLKTGRTVFPVLSARETAAVMQD